MTLARYQKCSECFVKTLMLLQDVSGLRPELTLWESTDGRTGRSDFLSFTFLLKTLVQMQIICLKHRPYTQAAPPDRTSSPAVRAVKSKCFQL